MSRFLRDGRASQALLLLVASCTGDAPWLAADAVPQRLIPRLVEAATGDRDAAWALFDRDVANGFTPTRAVTIAFDDTVALGAVRVFGASPYELTIVTSFGQVISGPHDLSELDDGWTSFALQAPFPIDSAVLRFEALGDESAPIGELELWGPGGALPVAFDPSADEIAPGLADVIASEDRVELAQGLDDASLPACASASFVVARHPGVYRRAWLRFSSLGVLRPWVLTRAINESAMTRGRWVPDASGETQTFVYPVDVELLRLGLNEAHFCLPGEARASVSLFDVALVAEVDHGGNIVEAVTLAPYDGIPTEDAFTLLGESDAEVSVTSDREIVVAFERLIAPHAIEIDGEFAARCVTASGGLQELTLSEAREGLYTIEGSERCAGLRLHAASGATLSRLRVFGSTANRRIDFPQIVLASAREHFGANAFVDGWARAPSDVGGGVLVSLDERPTDTTHGIYGELLTRTSTPTDAWTVTVGARFADGTTAARAFVLDRNGGTLPGIQGVETIDDGLTEEERRARFGEVGQTSEVTIASGAAGRVTLGTDVSVDVPAGALNGQTTISITHLDIANVPPLDPGIINVTAPFAHGYEMLPHGQTFEEPVTIGLPYQPSLIPAGYVPTDVQTFFYNTTEQRWEPLSKETTDRERQIVSSVSDHFTVMINAIVVSPEHPQVASFDPNRMSGIEPATPSAGINAIAPPEANPARRCEPQLSDRSAAGTRRHAALARAQLLLGPRQRLARRRLGRAGQRDRSRHPLGRPALLEHARDRNLRPRRRAARAHWACSGPSW